MCDYNIPMHPSEHHRQNASIHPTERRIRNRSFLWCHQYLFSGLGGFVRSGRELMMDGGEGLVQGWDHEEDDRIWSLVGLAVCLPTNTCRKQDVFRERGIHRLLDWKADPSGALQTT